MCVTDTLFQSTFSELGCFPDSIVAVRRFFPCLMPKLIHLMRCMSVRRLQLIVFVWSPRASSAEVDHPARHSKSVYKKYRPYRLRLSSPQYRGRRQCKLWVRMPVKSSEADY